MADIFKGDYSYIEPELPFQTFYGKKKVVKEVFEPNSSETEPGQEVSIHAVYERCLRGEMVPNVPGSYYEKEIGVLEHPDTDLSDVAVLADILAAKQERGKSEVGVQDGADSHKSSAGLPSATDDVATSATDS